MIQDLQDTPDGGELQADVCIVGAGPAGISLARSLRGSGLQVLLLESGGREREEAQADLARGVVDPNLKYFELHAARLRLLGGTSNHWAGQSYPLDPIDFETRDWVPDSGWPISHAEMSAYLPEAQELCRLGDQRWDWKSWSDKKGLSKNPYGDEMRVMPLRFSRPLVKFGEVYGEDLEKADDIRTVLHATLIGLEANADGTRVVSAQVSTVAGRTATVKAKRFVLACGGFENSRLLLLAQRAGGQPFGNQHDQVGRYVMEHPAVDTGEVAFEGSAHVEFVRKAFRMVGDQRIRMDVQLPAAEQERLQILNHAVFIHKKLKVAGNTAGVAALLDGLQDSDPSKPPVLKLRVRIEQAPYADSRITLHDSQTDPFGQPVTHLHWRMGELEHKTVATLEKVMARQLGLARVGRFRIPDRKNPGDWQKKVIWAYHHMGGTRMSSDPTRGVVDADCRVHGMSNLYLAGSSVFPTGGFTNPTLNLVALSLRLGAHLTSAAR